MTAVTDAFARGDNLDLGANWAVVGTHDNFKIVSEEITPESVANDAAECWTSDTFTDDQYSEATISDVTASSLSGIGIGVCVRATTASVTMYRAVVNAAVTDNIEVMKFISGASTSLGFRTQAFSSGDEIRLEVEGQDAAIVLRVYRNGSQIGTDIADSTGTHINSGRPGVAYSSTVGDVPTLDDWGGGDLAGAATQTICPDADITTTGWTSTPLWSKIGTPADATIITSTAA